LGKVGFCFHGEFVFGFRRDGLLARDPCASENWRAEAQDFASSPVVTVMLLDRAQEMLNHKIGHVFALLQSVPASEEAHRALMRVHLRWGRTNAALRQFEQCKEALQRELQAEPDVETRRLFASIQGTSKNSRSTTALCESVARRHDSGGADGSARVLRYGEAVGGVVCEG